MVHIKIWLELVFLTITVFLFIFLTKSSNACHLSSGTYYLNCIEGLYCSDDAACGNGIVIAYDWSTDLGECGMGCSAGQLYSPGCNIYTRSCQCGSAEAKWKTACSNGDVCKVRWNWDCSGSFEGKYDTSENKCVQCSGNKQVKAVKCGQPDDFTQKCESACGASSQCDEKQPGILDSVDKLCNSNCNYRVCDSTTICTQENVNYIYYCIRWVSGGISWWEWSITKPSTELSCSDGYDNDCDGKTDCADSDCSGNPNCVTTTIPTTTIPCKKSGESCYATSDCCSYYTSGSTCYYNPSCVYDYSPYCSFSSCSLSDSCTSNTLTVGKTCSSSGCSGTTYTCSQASHENCKSINCGGSTYYCTYDGSTWQWRTSKPAEVCNDNVDNDCDGKTDCADSDCSGNPNCVTTTTTTPTTTTTVRTTTTTVPTTTTTVRTTTTTVPTTTIPCGNGKCDYPSENQDNCNSDCYTVIKLYRDDTPIISSTILMPSEKIKVVVYFNDSRYNLQQGFNVMYKFWIDDTIIWDKTNGCEFCWKSLEEMGCKYRSNKMYWVSPSKDATAYMENGYGRIEFNATLPKTLSRGIHTIKVVPVILSSPVPLTPAESKVIIGDGLYTFVLIVKNIFSRITGLFIFV